MVGSPCERLNMQMPDTFKECPALCFTNYKNQEDYIMNDYHNEELKRLISESLRERPDSYLIQQLFEPI